MTNFERAQHEDEAIRCQVASAHFYRAASATVQTIPDFDDDRLVWTQAVINQDGAASAAYRARFHLFRALGDSAFMARSKASSKFGEYTVFPCQ